MRGIFNEPKHSQQGYTYGCSSRQTTGKASQKKLPLGLRATRGLFVAIGRVLITLILVGIITGCIVGCVLTVYILQHIGSDNSVDLEAVKMGYTSLMLAEDPKPVRKLF